MIPSAPASAEPAGAYLGQVLSTPDELDGLPANAIMVAASDAGAPDDPARGQLAMQRRETLYGSLYWYPAWDSYDFAYIDSHEAVSRFRLGPFTVVWLPPGGQF